MNYMTTVNRNFADEQTVPLPLRVSPADFPHRIRTQYLKPDHSIELLLDFQRGHESRRPLKANAIELEIGKETGRVYRCVIHEFKQSPSSFEARQLLHKFLSTSDSTHEKNTFFFCLVALREILDRESKKLSGL